MGKQLAHVCAGDIELCNRVRALLKAHADPRSFKIDPQWRLTRQRMTTSPSPSVLARCIGPYKLREQIGEGGFGVVYVAEQEKPVPRKVALKIIKPGMDTREVIARFEAERQALALMDHPNIAKVLDAGTTGETGSAGDRGPEPEVEGSEVGTRDKVTPEPVTR